MTTSTTVYGLLRLDGLDVALPLSALREVVPRPAALTPLPVAAAGLAGAMGLRSLVLPVVDLRPLLGHDDQARPDQVVVVVAHAGRVIGLVADEVRGVTRVPDADLLPFATADARLLVSHAFQHETDGLPVSVLDAEVLLSLPGVPTVAEPEPSASESEADGGAADAVRRGRAQSLTLVRCGSHALALEVDAIHTTIPLTAVAPSLLSGGDCVGTTEYAGQEIAVVDPLSLLGLPPLAPGDLGAGVVVDLGRGKVVLAVSELVELRDTGGGVLPVPEYATLRPDLVRGMVDLGDGSCLVLDGTALRSEPQLVALASVNTAAGATLLSSAGGTAEAAAVGGPTYVTYRAGVDLVTPLAQVGEVLPVPDVLTPTAAEQVLGVVVHRGHAIPVVCLSTLLGHPPAERPSTSCLLLVEADGEQVAFAVDALGGIEPLAWSDPQSRDRRLEDLARAVQDSPLVQVAGTDRLVPELDLLAVARLVRKYSTSVGESLSGPATGPMVAA